MKKVLLFGVCLALPALADFTPDSHAPAGVMYDHLHKQGEWMIGYRAMHQRFDDIRHGGGDVGRADLVAAGYSVAPTNMTMTMHMLEIMYAPTDDLTLMVMPQYMTMDMTMTPVGDGGHGHGHGDHGDADVHHGSHSHAVSGLGDTAIAALYRLGRIGDQEFIGTLGVSVPTGDVHKKNADGTFMHYGMQIGSGTWDLLPSLTYLGRHGDFSWGAQTGAVLRMEDSNEAGFAFGDRYHLTGWGAWRLASWVSTSLRVQYNKESDDLDGHFDGAHNHSSPYDRQGNYGGEWTELGLGVNTAIPSGVFGGLRVAAEYVFPVRDNYNGYQLRRQQGLNLNLSRAF